MAPILYMQNFSGPVRSVLLTAAALGIKLQHKIIDLSKQEHLTDSFLKVGGLVLFRVDLTTALPAEPPTHNTDARRQWDRHLGQSCHQCLSGGEVRQGWPALSQRLGQEGAGRPEASFRQRTHLQLAQEYRCRYSVFNRRGNANREGIEWCFKCTPHVLDHCVRVQKKCYWYKSGR